MVGEARQALEADGAVAGRVGGSREAAAVDDVSLRARGICAAWRNGVHGAMITLAAERNSARPRKKRAERRPRRSAFAPHGEPNVLRRRSSPALRPVMHSGRCRDIYRNAIFPFPCLYIVRRWDVNAGRQGVNMALTKRELEVLAAFRYKLRQFLAFSEKASSAVGLTAQQYQALLAMRVHAGPEPLTISDLAGQMLIKHHSAVGMVNRLEQQGMVRREGAGTDRRKVAIRLTEQGARVFARLASVHLGELRRIAPDLERFFGYFGREARGGRGGRGPANPRRRTRS